MGKRRPTDATALIEAMIVEREEQIKAEALELLKSRPISELLSFLEGRPAGKKSIRTKAKRARKTARKKAVKGSRKKGARKKIAGKKRAKTRSKTAIEKEGRMKTARKAARKALNLPPVGRIPPEKSDLFEQKVKELEKHQ